MEDGTEYEDVHEVDHTYGTSYPIHALTWALFGTKDVISTTHIDAGGFSTFIHPILGKKIWIVAAGNQLPSKTGFEDDGTYVDENEDEDDETSPAAWQAVVLNPGDDL